MSSPTLLAISGSNDFQRRRHVDQTIAKQRLNGWDVQFVDGSDTHSFMAALHQSVGSLGDTRPVLVIVDNPEKAPLPVLENFKKNESPPVTVLLLVDGDPKGNTKFGKFVTGFDKKSHVTFQVPDKRWEMPKFAADFCVSESKKMGKPIGDELATSIVKTCGTDLGFLYFEVQKSVMHAESRGSDVVAIDDVRVSISPIGEASFDPIRDALIARSRKALLQSLNRIKKTIRDPVMPVCGFLENIAMGHKTEKDGKVSFGWIHLTTLSSRGMTPDQIATELDVNQWRCKNFLLPEVRMWGPADVMAIIKATSTAKRAVLNGSIDPWTVLVSLIAGTCHSK